MLVGGEPVLGFCVCALHIKQFCFYSSTSSKPSVPCRFFTPRIQALWSQTTTQRYNNTRQQIRQRNGMHAWWCLFFSIFSFRLFSLLCYICFFFVLSVASPPGGHDCGITTAVDKTRKTRLTKAGRRRQTG